MPSYDNPQDLNRFSYVLNNPLRYTDPTGNRACGDGEGMDCNGHKQDPKQNPHLPKPHKPKDEKPKMCSTNPNGCIVGGALLIVFTDLFVGLPATAVIILGGGATPPAIAAEVLETTVVLPINIFGINLIKKGREIKNRNP